MFGNIQCDIQKVINEKKTSKQFFEWKPPKCYKLIFFSIENKGKCIQSGSAKTWHAGFG